MTKLEIYLNKLEKLADRATPGPWKALPGDSFDHWQLYNNKTSEFIVQDDSGVEPPSWFLNYLEEFNPQTIKALVQVVRAVKEADVYHDPRCSRFVYMGKSCDCGYISLQEAMHNLESLIHENNPNI